MIELKKVCYTYSKGSAFEHDALTDIDLTINENEFCAVIGHTGSGKSTLITHMNGLLQPTSGKVFVDGIDMSDKSARRKGRSLVGLVFQYAEYQLFEETVAKDVSYGPRNMGLSEDECTARVKEAMSLVGLNYAKFAEKSPFDLSGGERRRAALAGIIAMRPKYLVLDEPMAGLDPQGRKNILSTLADLRKALPCAVIMVSHSMDDVANSAERVIVMNNSRIVYDDKPQKVFSHTDELRKMGLDIPTACKISEYLRVKGIDIPSDICRMDDLSEYLTGRLISC